MANLNTVMHPKGVYNLRDAIVLRACDDYIAGYKALKKCFGDLSNFPKKKEYGKYSHITNAQYYYECLDFFNKELTMYIDNADPSYFIKNLNEMADEELKEKRKYRTPTSVANV